MSPRRALFVVLLASASSQGHCIEEGCVLGGMRASTLLQIQHSSGHAKSFFIKKAKGFFMNKATEGTARASTSVFFPEPVRQAVENKFPGMKVRVVTLSEDSTYSVEFGYDNQEGEVDSVSVSPDGTIVHVSPKTGTRSRSDTGIGAMDFFPVSVSKVLQDRIPGMKLKRVQFEQWEHDESGYEVEFEHDGQRGRVNISPDGVMRGGGGGDEEEEIEPFVFLRTPIREALEKKYLGMKITVITEGDEDSITVEFVQDSNEGELKVSSDGTIGDANFKSGVSTGSGKGLGPMDFFPNSLVTEKPVSVKITRVKFEHPGYKVEFEHNGEKGKVDMSSDGKPS